MDYGVRERNERRKRKREKESGSRQLVAVASYCQICLRFAEKQFNGDVFDVPFSWWILVYHFGDLENSANFDSVILMVKREYYLRWIIPAEKMCTPKKKLQSFKNLQWSKMSYRSTTIARDGSQSNKGTRPSGWGAPKFNVKNIVSCDRIIKNFFLSSLQC